MAKNKDWLPENNEALYNQSVLTKQYLSEHLVEFGISMKSAEWVTGVFDVAQQAYANAFLAWQDPSERTKAKSAALNDARKAFEPAYRELYNGFLKSNPNVSNEDLVRMGLPQRSDRKPTPSPVPQTYPDLVVEPAGIRSIRVIFRDHGKSSSAKPHGVGGAVLRWAILPAPPASVDELTHSALDTRSPYIFTFDESERGKTFYVAAAWQNTRGEMGAFSEIENTIVP